MKSSFSSVFRTALTVSSVLILSACPSNTSPVNPPRHNTQITPPPKPQAVVALALGGGASKGFAHIGIIKALKQNGIPVKIVTGTSAGAIVGSLYASGASPDRLELEAEILGSTDLVDLTLSTSGFIKGQKLQDYINRKVGNRPIQDFPIKFAAVATDFESSKAVAFNRGNAGQAVRASAAIPNVFQPVLIGGRRYVDGGLTQPVPVSAAKKQGANFIIAVDISDRPSKNLEQGFFSYLDQSINVMSQSALQHELSKANVVIHPQVLDLGAVGGFSQKQRAIAEGERAAKAAIPEIRRKLAAYRY